MFLPPDPDNHIEMRLIIGLVSAVGRANAWVFAFICILLAFYGVVRLALYLGQIFKERAFTREPYAKKFQVVMAIGIGVLIVGLALCGDIQTFSWGVSTLCWGFGAITVTTVILDRRIVVPEPPSLEDVTLDQILKWKKDE